MIWRMLVEMTGNRVVTDEGDLRRRERVPLAIQAQLRDRRSNKYVVHLIDLSVTGFRAEAHYGLDPGSIVWLTIPGMQGMEAVVAWRRGQVIGCQFRNALYPPVFDHIVRTLTQ